MPGQRLSDISYPFLEDRVGESVTEQFGKEIEELYKKEEKAKEEIMRKIIREEIDKSMENTKDKLSSIEVSRNAKGQFSFKVKFYFNEEEVSSENVVSELETTMNNLEMTFDGGK